MKSIRIKVKTLLILGLLIIVAFVYSEEIFYTAASLGDKVGLTENASYWSLKTDSLYGEDKRIEMILEAHDYEIYNIMIISDGIFASSTRIRYQDAENVYKAYEKYKEEALSKENYDYMINVAMLQWFAGAADRTYNILNEIPIDLMKQEDRDKYYLFQAGIDLTYSRYALVMSSLSHVSDTHSYLVHNIKAFMTLVFDYPTNVDLDHVQTDDFDYKSDYYLYFDEIRMGLSEYLNEFTRDNIYGQPITISGRVTIDGQPVQGAIVYAKGYNGTSSNEGYTKNSAVTNEDGYYQLDSKDKMKGLGIKLPWQVVHDKRLERQWTYDYSKDTVRNFEFESGIRFKEAYIEDDYFIYEIEDHKDASEYRVKISSTDPELTNDQSYFSVFEKKGKIPMADIHRATRFRFGWISSEDVFDIKMLTETLYLSGDYYFSVDRVNASYIYATNGFFTDTLSTVISYEGHDYNEGDLLIQEDKIEEALQWYSEHLDRHNLKVLVALYTYGTKAEEGDKYSQRLSNHDYEKAIYYSNKLIELDGKSYMRLSSLADLYKRSRDYEKEGQVLLECIEMEASVYDYIRLGNNRINLGLYQEGIQIYLEHGDMIHEGDRYYARFILGNELEYLPLEIKEPLDKKDLSDFEPFFEKIQRGDYESAYKRLLSMPESDLKTFYYLMFLDAFDFEFIDYPYEHGDDQLFYGSNFIDYYRDETKSIKDRDIESVLKFLKENYNWF